jgi:gluconokinase
LTLGVDRPEVRLIHLHAPQSLLEKRMAERKDHFMPKSLLHSQMETLESPAAEEAFQVDVSLSAEASVEAVLNHLGYCEG